MSRGATRPSTTAAGSRSQGRWGWVPGPTSAHPVWSPALVVFAGGIQVGGVAVSAWFPLGPGEPYRPWYPCSPRYIDQVNISNMTEAPRVHVHTTYVNINVVNVTYVNRTIGVTAISHADFAAGRPAARPTSWSTSTRWTTCRPLAAPVPRPTARSVVGHSPGAPGQVNVARPVLMPVCIQVDDARAHRPLHAPSGTSSALTSPITSTPPTARSSSTSLPPSALSPSTSGPTTSSPPATESGSLKWGSANVYTERPDGTPGLRLHRHRPHLDALRSGQNPPTRQNRLHARGPFHAFPNPIATPFPRETSLPARPTRPSTKPMVRVWSAAYDGHLLQRYGDQTATWLGEVWNKPTSPTGTAPPPSTTASTTSPSAAIRSVLPTRRIGGPEATGVSDHSEPFLRQFLDHCAHGVNAATGETGAPLDFISYHPKGSPSSSTVMSR